MAVRARPDNLSLDTIADDRPDVVDFADLWAARGEVHSVCERMVGGTGDTDDVVQDTFLRALRNVDRLDRRVPYAAWLATVARRRSIDELRARKRVQLVAAVPEPEGAYAADPLEQILHQEALDRVEAALRTLTSRERRLLLRQVSHDLSIAELAESEATTEASVRSVLTRARSKLRATVERDGPLVATPGIVAAVRRRLQRWTAALDGRAPALAGLAAQFGDVVVAAIAAGALLLADAAPAPEVVLAAEVIAVESGAPRTAAPSNGSDSGGQPASGDKKSGTPPSSTTTTTAMAPPTTLVPSPSEFAEVPWLRDPGGELPDAAFIDSFASSSDGRVVLASGATGNRPSVYRSDDGGRSWRRLPAAGFFGGRLLVGPSFPVDPTILVAVDGGPLMRSDDGGAFFGPAAAGRGGHALLPGYGLQHRRVVSALPQLVSYDVDTRASTPIGLGPEVVGIGNVAPTPAYPDDPLLLVGGQIRSGNRWVGTVHRCRGFDPCTAVTLASSATAPTIHTSSTPDLVLAHAGRTLHRSTDGGATFSEVPLPPGITIRSVIDGSPGELLLAALFPAGRTDEGLLRSTDGGQSWTPMAAGRFAGGSNEVTRLADGTILAALGPDRRGLLCSADNGASWAARCPA